MKKNSSTEQKQFKQMNKKIIQLKKKIVPRKNRKTKKYYK